MRVLLRLLGSRSRQGSILFHHRCYTSLSVEEFSRLGPMTLLQSALRQYTAMDGTALSEAHQNQNHIIISRDKFDALCRQCHITDTAAALQRLEEAAVVVSLYQGSLVHLRPVLYVDTVERSSGAEGRDHFLLEQVEENIRLLEAEEQKMRLVLRPAIARAAKWRRSVWGGAVLFAGSQLAIIARLTYFDLDWDIMEPVSYLIGVATATFFYIYFLRYDDEHTYTDFDKRYMARKVRQYAPKDFNWETYQHTCSLLVEEKDVQKRLQEFAKGFVNR